MREVEERLMTPKKFSIAIEKTVKQSGISYMDALVDYCNKNQIEPEQIKPLITKSLKEKVEVISKKDHSIPKENTFTSDRMTQETIDLYHRLLIKDS